MLDVLTFVFQDFWHWFGTATLLSIVMGGLSQMRLVQISMTSRSKSLSLPKLLKLEKAENQ
jgi:hypothetical protein